MSAEAIDLDAAQALVDAASPGPWVTYQSKTGGLLHVSIPAAMNPTAWCCDAEFIAQARTLVPSLIEAAGAMLDDLSTAYARAEAAEAKLAEARRLASRAIDKLDETASGLGDWHDATEYLTWARSEVRDIWLATGGA